MPQCLQSKELQASNAQQTAEIQKLTEASARVRSLEEANANQALEIQRLLEAQLADGDTTKTGLLKEEYAELEDDCLKYGLCISLSTLIAPRTSFDLDMAFLPAGLTSWQIPASQPVLFSQKKYLLAAMIHHSSRIYCFGTCLQSSAQMQIGSRGRKVATYSREELNAGGAN